jgi:hypothetical protein
VCGPETERSINTVIGPAPSNCRLLALVAAIVVAVLFAVSVRPHAALAVGPDGAQLQQRLEGAGAEAKVSKQVVAAEMVVLRTVAQLVPSSHPQVGDATPAAKEVEQIDSSIVVNAASAAGVKNTASPAGERTLIHIDETVKEEVKRWIPEVRTVQHNGQVAALDFVPDGASAAGVTLVQLRHTERRLAAVSTTAISGMAALFDLTPEHPA